MSEKLDAAVLTFARLACNHTDYPCTAPCETCKKEARECMIKLGATE